MLVFQIDKQFGYFRKDAVKLDEVFVDEKKEIEMSTQVRFFRRTRRGEKAPTLLCLLPFCHHVSCEYFFFREQTSSVRTHLGQLSRVTKNSKITRLEIHMPSLKN